MKADTFSYHTSFRDRLIGVNGSSIAYDDHGNLQSETTPSGQILYSWHREKLASVRYITASSEQTVSFVYDAYGRRIQKKEIYSSVSSDSSETTEKVTKYTYDSSDRLMKETISLTINNIHTTSSILYIYNGNSVEGIMHTSAGVTRKYLFDKNPKGDVVAILDNAGNVVVKYVYDAYGNCNIVSDLTSNGLASLNPIRYRGYYYDIETKLYYLNARYYNPAWRRFISLDDTAYLDPETPNGLNLYAYCYNDPVNYADPSGHSAFLIAMSILAVAGLITTGIGVATDNNIFTAIGLTAVAIPAMITGSIAIVSGATYLGIIGFVTFFAGLSSGLFATAEYGEAFTGNNWIIDAGLNETWYNGLLLFSAVIATAGTVSCTVLSTIGNATTPNQMMDSLKNHPKRWKETGKIPEPATGRKYRGAESFRTKYINRWTGARGETHIIIRDGKILHGPHYHS